MAGFAPTLGSEPLRLLCFPYAGGGASTYRSWASWLPSDVALCPVQLPGRETRMKEPAIGSLPALIELLVRETAQLRRGRFAFFGHSLGGLLAFELTRALRRRGERLPAQLFVSACRAPQLVEDERTLATLDDGAFVAALRTFEGTPDRVLEDPELLPLLLPTLRADFGLREGYACAEESPLPLPIAVFGGEDDAHVAISSLFAWRLHTSRSFSLTRFAGGHFYFRGQPEFQRALSGALARLTRRGRGRSKEEEHHGTRH